MLHHQHHSFESFSAMMDEIRKDALAGDQRATALYLNTLQRMNPSFNAIVGNGAGCSLNDLLQITVKPFQYYRYLMRQPACASLRQQPPQPQPHQPHA